MLAFLRRTPLYDAWVFLRLRREFRAWERRGRVGPSPHLLKQRLLLALARSHGIECLVETGTYMGTMVAAVQAHFARVDSVELDPYLARRATQRFAHLDHVHVHQGNSGSVLRGILDTVTHPTLFWLDAHYSGGITARGDSETPIAAELGLIFGHGGASRHVVAVDDARLFDGTHDYPTIDGVRAILARAAPGHDVEVRDDIIRITPRAPAAGATRG